MIRHVNIPALILSSCVLFNFILCFVHTNVMPVSTSWIMLCELGLVGIAFLCGMKSIDKSKIYWLYVLGAQSFIVLLLCLVKEDLLIKPLRDLILMPVFVILGLSAAKINMTRFVVVILSTVGAAAIWEMLAPQQFLQIFNFRDYYIAKGTLDEDFILPLNTFASGVRPQGRFLFDLPDVHRISSVFLEPVSLGFFSFMIALYAISISKYISRAARIFILLSSTFLIWLSDARMALGCLILSFLFAPLFKRVDHRFSVLVFPAILVLSFLLNEMGVLNKEGEGLGARLHSTMTLLSETTWEKLAGIKGYEYFTADSAFGELLHNVGFIGFLLFWLAPIFFMRAVHSSARIYIFGLSIYVGCAFMLSAAIFTIKTAALLWFFYGYIIARSRLMEERSQSA